MSEHTLTHKMQHNQNDVRNPDRNSVCYLCRKEEVNAPAYTVLISRLPLSLYDCIFDHQLTLLTP